MTTISGQNFFTPQQNAACGCDRRPAVDGAVFVKAAGIFGQSFNRLGNGPFAFPKMPKLFNISCGKPPSRGFPRCGPCVLPQPQNSWTASMTGANTAKINLGDGYKLDIDERSSQISILNDNTGERTRIWGDPHVEIDGKHAFDFWGTTSFNLENGTKITINTEQWGGNPNAYVASQIVVTKGSNALVIDGVSQNKLGDLQMTLSNNGYRIDAAHRDGYKLSENGSGSGWRTESGNIAKQTDLDATRIGREYGPGSKMLNFDELGGKLSQFLLYGSFLNFARDLGQRVSDSNDSPPPRQNPFRFAPNRFFP
jgi:Domain of Unknown Function (DUF1521)